MEQSNSENPVASEARALECVVVTPEATVLEASADFVALPLYDGELGVGRGHAPMIGRLGYGELRIEMGGDTRRFYVDGGFVQIAEGQVSVLTNRAIPADDLDLAVTEELLSSAIARPASGEDQLAIRERNVAQARAQKRIATSR